MQFLLFSVTLVVHVWIILQCVNSPKTVSEKDLLFPRPSNEALQVYTPLSFSDRLCITKLPLTLLTVSPSFVHCVVIIVLALG